MESVSVCVEGRWTKSSTSNCQYFFGRKLFTKQEFVFLEHPSRNVTKTLEIGWLIGMAREHTFSLGGFGDKYEAIEK